jgi:hypothetical protein
VTVRAGFIDVLDERAALAGTFIGCLLRWLRLPGVALAGARSALGVDEDLA